ncbi:accessory Sec system protein Asp2 [Leuconostoc holzapfelii]|uniref:Accessory Sec system protein Asp2 n=1 Tax=Leuconostoc holzapfelii TaxID=434464 RepID=A0A846ZEZ6_9LACO|nr:accessory Sec system protein Asp2 [Leuconostoc holzapfelii]NKZ17645.1 accessory Sec system protein Asp2 [Leuconostoc holzapfelii]
MKEDKISVLQTGMADWSDILKTENDFLSWSFLPSQTSLLDFEAWVEENGQPSVLLLTEISTIAELEAIMALVDPYRIVVDIKEAEEDVTRRQQLKSHFASYLDFSNKENVIYQLTKYFYFAQYGDRIRIEMLHISPDFYHDVTYFGSSEIDISGEFGQSYQSVASWQFNAIAEPRFNHEYWLEHTIDETLEAELVVRLLTTDSLKIVDSWTVNLKNQVKPIVIASDLATEYYLSFTIRVKGYGKLSLGSLHHRRSRLDFGQFLVGGQRLVDQKSEEIMTYFYPGNLKPPLNVYFSGYRTAEGFEGFPMMKKLRQPFILIADPRLEGGAFYIGSPEMEAKIIKVIRDQLADLGFSSEQLILSGLSMGTFGALYYASNLEPGAVIVGKPLANLGNIAANGVFLRPGEFGTASDLLLQNTGGTTSKHVDMLNQRFWHKFSKTPFNHTTFAIAYMRDDDYDQTAYDDLLETLGNSRAMVIGKGISGRHNDNTGEIIEWFLNQYQRIIKTFS